MGQDLGHYLTKSREEGKEAKIICLYGELGSGKTTFVQGFARGLGIVGRLLSPTFIIVRRYLIPGLASFLYHLDLYRLKQAHDLHNLGLTEIFSQTGNFVVVEWAEKLGKYRPDSRLDICFTRQEDGSHKINLCQR